MLSTTKTTAKSAQLLRSLTGRRNPSVSFVIRRSVSHLMTTPQPASSTSTSVAHPSSSWKQRQQLLFVNDKNINDINQQQTRSIFIQSEETPNPESIKFIPTGIIVLPDSTDGGGYFVTKTDPTDSVLRSPLAKDLFKIEGIKAVYLGADFVTITKYAQGNWKLLRPEILDCLMNFFDTDVPALRDQPEITDTTILDDDDEIVAMIKELIESRIRPAVQEDGGDIRYVGFEEETGLVTVELAGSCVGCPSSSVTLKQGVENMLQHYIPEVTAVVALEEELDESEENGNGEEAEVQEKQKSYEERLKAAGIPFSD